MQQQPSDDLTPAQKAMVDLIEQHRHAELDELNVDDTLSTMAADPYLFFVATAGGGEGQNGVRTFYTAMLKQLPKDMEWVFISRTIGTETIIIETILTFTHSIKMDWLLPGVPPTGKRVEIPMVIIFSFRDGKIESERLYWDQASTLVQLGVLEIGSLPIVGSESPNKLLKLIRGRPSEPSKEFRNWHVIESVSLGAPAEKVWEVVGGFFNIHEWHPDIEATEFVENQTDISSVRRLLTFPGQPKTTEELIFVDHDDFHYGYKWHAGEWGQHVQNYVANIRVFGVDGGQRSIMQWSSTFYCNENAVSEFYWNGFRALQKLFP